MKKVIILHAWGAGPKSFWYKKLGQELAESFTVSIPFLADPRKPTLKKWLNSVVGSIEKDSEVSIVGHSLGAVLGLKLAEKYKLEKLILVAGWDYWDLTAEHKSFFEKQINHQKIIRNVSERIVIHSNNDPYFTNWQSEQLTKRLNALDILIKGRGHFMKESDYEAIALLLRS